MIQWSESPQNGLAQCLEPYKHTVSNLMFPRCHYVRTEEDYDAFVNDYVTTALVGTLKIVVQAIGKNRTIFSVKGTVSLGRHLPACYSNAPVGKFHLVIYKKLTAFFLLLCKRASLWQINNASRNIWIRTPNEMLLQQILIHLFISSFTIHPSFLNCSRSKSPKPSMVSKYPSAHNSDFRIDVFKPHPTASYRPLSPSTLFVFFQLHTAFRILSPR